MIDISNITEEFTESADEALHLILDLKQNKEVDLYKLQSLILNMYRNELELTYLAVNLSEDLENRKRKEIEIPSFMLKKGKKAQ